MGARVDTSHFRIVALPFSTPPPITVTETSRLPSGLKAMLDTSSSPVVSGAPIGARPDTSHSRTVPSRPADANLAPSGLNVTQLTPPGWPASGPPMPLPLDASQSRTVPSPPADAKRVPSGLNASE